MTSNPLLLQSAKNKFFGEFAARTAKFPPAGGFLEVGKANCIVLLICGIKLVFHAVKTIFGVF